MEQEISGTSKFREVEQNFRNERFKNGRSIQFSTRISGIFGLMSRVLYPTNITIKSNFYLLAYIYLHEVFSQRAENHARAVILHFNWQIQVFILVTLTLLIDIFSMSCRKTSNLFEPLWCFSVVVLFEFREEASDKKHSDHPFQCRERDN